MERYDWKTVAVQSSESPGVALTFAQNLEDIHHRLDGSSCHNEEQQLEAMNRLPAEDPEETAKL